MGKTIRIKFAAEVYIEAETLEEANGKWQGMSLWSEEAKKCGADYSDTLLVEDADTFKDLTSEWNNL